jgi:hypothetical protein
MDNHFKPTFGSIDTNVSSKITRIPGDDKFNLPVLLFSKAQEWLDSVRDSDVEMEDSDHTAFPDIKEDWFIEVHMHTLRTTTSSPHLAQSTPM